MKVYVLDANAVIRYLTEGPGAERMEELFTQVKRNEAHLSISVVNRGEVLYHLAKSGGLDAAQQTLRSLSKYIESFEVTEALADAAAAMKYSYKLGYADCFAAALAVSLGATLVTADPEFAKLGKKLKLLALPRHKG